MYNGLLHAHSGLRYVVLILMLLAIYKAFVGWKSKAEVSEGQAKVNKFAVISAHIQMTIGLIVYFISPIVEAARSNMSEAMKDPELRFWTVEHMSMMLVAVALITIGNARAKRVADHLKKNKAIVIFFTLALVVILMAIPWPFSAISRPWF